jgi:hypothetical protein
MEAHDNRNQDITEEFSEDVQGGKWIHICTTDNYPVKAQGKINY